MTGIDGSTGKRFRCDLCGETVEDVEAGNTHLKNEHSLFDLLKHDLVERNPPIQGDRSA